MKTIVVGGGAAGFFAAIHNKYEHPNQDVIIIEKSAELLSKVRISGGGRCNVTHACFDPQRLCDFYPRGSKELRGPFHRFQPEDTMSWFESRGVPLKIEPDQRVFPVSNSSEDIVNCLINEAKQLGVAIWTECRIQHISRSTAQFCITLHNDQTHYCDKLILATGSNRQGYSFADSLGHRMIPPVPSLFTFKIDAPELHALKGLSVNDTEIHIDLAKSQRHRGPLLITHWGLSGPSIIKCSAWQAIALHQANYHCTLYVNWLANNQLNDTLQQLQHMIHTHPKQQIFTHSPFPELPQRLWKFLIQKWDLALPQSWHSIQDSQRKLISERLHSDPYLVSGKGTFKEEFVTCGGVALNEIDFKSMQSRVCPGLHIVGELLNIDGITGGFNFQSAWTTGALSA